MTKSCEKFQTWMQGRHVSAEEAEDAPQDIDLLVAIAASALDSPETGMGFGSDEKLGEYPESRPELRSGGILAPYEEARWCDSSASAGTRGLDLTSPESVRRMRDHLRTCADCRREARKVARLDRALARSLSTLGRIVGDPSQERIDATLQCLRETPPEVALLRRIRKPLRMILWGAFLGLTLLAFSYLAFALYRAIKGA